MGIFDICCCCCSGDTVLPDTVPRMQITRSKPSENADDIELTVESGEGATGEAVEGLVDGVEGTPNVAVGGTPSLAIKRPLKECRLKPARHRITLTGAVAAVPPCSAAECVGNIPKVSSSKVPLGPGAYLIYSQDQNGSLSISFTKQAPTSLDGVLAYIKPTGEFSTYHYTNEGGCKVVATDLQLAMQSQYASDRKPFYEAWTQFLKLTVSANGTLYLLEASGMSPPPKVELVLFKDGNVTTADKLVSLDLSGYGVVGVLPPAFDYKSAGVYLIISGILGISQATAFLLHSHDGAVAPRERYVVRQTVFRTYNAPPKGSRLAREMEKADSDPISTSPWVYEHSLLDSFTKDQSFGYRFFKNEWAYLDHSMDPCQPAGILEGGKENYTGKGLVLEGGTDRQRTERMPYHLDHGVRWRERAPMGAVTFTIRPDANQDVRLDETDLDLEARQWGSWSRPMYSYLPIMDSAFRSRNRIDNPTDICYPWLVRHDVFERSPVYMKRAPSFIPEPDPDMLLAAAGTFAGYMQRPFILPSEALRRQNRLLTEWDRLEAEYAKNPDEAIAGRIRSIKNALFGYNNMVDDDSPEFTTAVEAAITMVREITKEQRDDPAHNPDVIDYYLRKVPDPTAVGGGCSRYEGPGKTVVLCLVGYYPDPKYFRQYTSIEELAEAYHRLMTEMRFEGNSHTNSQMVIDQDVHDYLLRRDRRKFPSLMAQYAPLWSHRKFGPEFGDALKRGQAVAESELTTFGTRLRKRKRGYSKEERAQNFVDDYACFSQECG
ncbi:hypothetical protein BaOVIS_031690 [Babesia ovis]|uniref:Immune mapped protein 2 N-terminal domain-containing protein n=1 Tax=Babesia ovis TaxID=5869 RepID=A0A9W5TD61_BABOV|nr:hypothetical protein BaOVIS_031690 [Babesia ovis]